MTLRQEILDQVANGYGIAPDYPFDGLEDACVLRRLDNRKWFALIMRISASKLGQKEDRMLDILNVKCDPNLIGSLRMSPGFFPAYHMNKESWITIALDGTVALEQIMPLIAMSHDLVANKKKKKAGNA